MLLAIRIFAVVLLVALGGIWAWAWVTRAPGEATTPHETLEIGFFEMARLPQPFVPIHEVRVRDAEQRGADVMVR